MFLSLPFIDSKCELHKINPHNLAALCLDIFLTLQLGLSDVVFLPWL